MVRHLLALPSWVKGGVLAGSIPAVVLAAALIVGSAGGNSGNTEQGSRQVAAAPQPPTPASTAAPTVNPATVMQRIIMTVIVLVAMGIVSAFAASELVPSHDAGAAPSAQQVREQNLDGSGFIRAHEQGTANVNVTNGSLPVSGTVNVGNFPAAAQGRLISLGTQSGATVDFPPVNVSDCSQASIFARLGATAGSVAVARNTNASPDGASLVQLSLAGEASTGDVAGVPTASLIDVPMTLPFLGVRANVSNSVGDVTAWIWCEP